MIISRIENDRPVTTIAVGSGLGTVQRILVLLDTGFTAELKIPDETADQLGITRDYVEKVSLAAGAQIEMWVGSAYVSLEGHTEKVSVLIGGRPGIGVGLLRRFGYVLNMDFSTGDFYLKRKEEDFLE